MRILQFTSTLAGGGAERLVAQLAPLMQGNGGDTCDVLTLSGKNAVYLEPLRDSGVLVHIAPYKSRYDLRLLFFAARLFKRYDIVHAHTFPAIYWASLVARFCRTKLIMTEHSTFNRRRKFFWLKPIEKFIYRRYDAVISVGEAVRAALLRWLKPQETQKYLVIKNGIDFNRFKFASPLARDELGACADALLLVTAGSFREPKNHVNLIKAMAFLPEQSHVLLAGEGALLEPCAALAKNLGLEERVHFLGFRRDIERVMQTADILVIPSLWEGCPLVAAEAMASGKPIAASDAPGLSEVIGSCGILFDPKNPEDIAEKILTLISDKELSAKYAAKAEFHANEYSIENMVDEYMRLYTGLMKEN